MTTDDVVTDPQWRRRWGGVLSERTEPAIDPHTVALVLVDMQYSQVTRDHGIGARLRELGTEDTYAYYFDRLETLAIPNMARLQEAFRAAGAEVVFLRLASLVDDSRDLHSMSKRDSPLRVSAADPSAQVIDQLKPLPNELVVVKPCSGVFNGTAFDQLVRNMGIDTLVFCGVATNYCVETAVRDSGDRGFQTLMVSDACAAITAEQERLAAEVLDGVYCAVRTTDEVVALLEAGAAPVA